jgi:hypothetical protein
MKRVLNAINLLSLFCLVVLALVPSAALAGDDTLTIDIPDQEYGYVYEIIPDKFDYQERLDRLLLYADVFGLSGPAANISEIREHGNAFAAFLGDNRWTYGYHEISGQEFFADLERFTMSYPEEGLDLIGEEKAMEVSLDAIGYLFADSPRAEITTIRVSRLWDYVQLTPDEVKGEIQKTSNETVVKVFRAIDGIPVYGPGGFFRVHVGNDASLHAVFDLTHQFEESPVDVIKLPTYDEVVALAEEKMAYYCANAVRCRVRARVGYYENGRSTVQKYLEPLVIFEIAKLTAKGDTEPYDFAVPLRDPAIADVTIPEFEEQAR